MTMLLNDGYEKSVEPVLVAHPTLRGLRMPNPSRTSNAEVHANMQDSSKESCSITSSFDE